ncbi:MAG: aldehyde dehydrogenase family protein [Candidatus Eiseniibacteriota bacterium]|nr:MAG: aldehyde dehydrogenase family protein [Candidatus Eisenbacteria bacterium]
MEYKNFINGKWVGSKNKEKFENRNPANWDELIGVFPKSGAEDVDDAVAAAEEAFKKWRLVPAPKRGEILFRTGELLRKHKEEISRDMTREMGKIIQETRGDTQEGIDTAYYAAGEGRRLFGETTPAELPNKFAMSIRQPIGVCGIISPWNFPMAIPTWKIFPALLCGNTVVFKPASDTPLTAVRLVEILAEAGLPAGVVNLVHGTGSGVGTPLVEHPRVRLISFTGSSDVGKQIAASGGKTLKRISLELGGKNAQIVMDDADLKLAVEGALWGAFGTTGQRCTATSRLILHEKIKDDFLSMFLERVEGLKLGNGLDSRTDVGPLVNKAQREQIQSYVDIGLGEGAKLVAGGKAYEEGECQKGWFYEPTVFDGVEPDMRIAQEEIFGPVLSVLKAGSLSEAIAILNNSDYGLSSSIYTSDVNTAHVAMRDIEAGITYINGPTIGAEVHLPFGGVKDTGNGHRESGTAVLDVFTEWKSIYVDYSGRLQKAQIDAVTIE